MKTRRLKRQPMNLLLGLMVWVVACVIANGSYAHGEATKGGFDVKKVGSRYKPVVHDLRKHMVFRLPGTDMTFAAWAYVIPGDDMPAPRYGFFLKDGRFFTINELDEPVDEARYGITDEYFAVDGFAAGSSHSTSMYLFKYGRDWVMLCDMLEDPYIAHHRFVLRSHYPGEPPYGREGTFFDPTGRTPVWLIRDKDGQGRALLRIRLYMDPYDSELDEFYEKRGLDPGYYEGFDLYFRIMAPEGGRPVLRLALDADLYKPVFDSLKGRYEKGVRPAAYYIYGFLAGQLGLPRIKAELTDSKVRQYAVDMLEDVDKLDAAFHDRPGGRPIPKIVEYKLKRR